MNGNNRFGKNTLTGGALLILSLIVIVIGVIVSLRTGDNRFFMAASVLAAIQIVAGGYKIRQGILTGENRLLLSGGESTITAEVLGVTRNLRTAGEKTAYYIVCRYKDPVTGREETFSSRPLEDYPGKEVIGKKVTVHLDPLERGKYTVEIDALLEEVRWERAAAAQPASASAGQEKPAAKSAAAQPAAPAEQEQPAAPAEQELPKHETGDDASSRDALRNGE